MARRPVLLVLALLGTILFLLTNPVLGRVRYSSAGTGAAKAFDPNEAARQAQTASATQNMAGTHAATKTTEKDVLEDMLRESDVLHLLEQEQKKHEKRLKELQNRLERELQQVQEHFDNVMLKLKKTEAQLEQNLKNVEKSLIQQVKASNERSESVSSGWRWPFFILILLVLGVGGFFGKLYRNATKGMRML